MGVLQSPSRSFLIYTVLILVCILSIIFIPTGECQQEDKEQIREQTERSLVHIDRAESFIKAKDYQRALLEYNYVLKFYPESIYAAEAQKKIAELTPRVKPRNLEKEQAIISPSRLSFMPTPETLRQGVLSIGGGTSILGEFKAGIYDWLEVGLISGCLVEVKTRIIKESSLMPGIALGAVAPFWDLEIGEVYGVAGKKLGRLHAYAGWSYIAGESAAFAGAKLVLDKRGSILLEYNQPIFYEEDIFDLIDFSQNLNTGMAALRFIFPHNIGVETGIGMYTDYYYEYEYWDENLKTYIQYSSPIKKVSHDYFLRLQLFWSVWL